jgi:hypothetical protein
MICAVHNHKLYVTSTNIYEVKFPRMLRFFTEFLGRDLYLIQGNYLLYYLIRNLNIIRKQSRL